ncbi:DUF3352 domain-containing protein [Limnospira platensis]|uniref:DUF3352 domain-containing protein n=2 Tax=Limnospira platensis TaxID=118562 RepID=UPI003DA11DF6
MSTLNITLKKSKLIMAAVAIAFTGTVAILLHLRALRVQVYSPEDSVRLVPENALMAVFVTPNPSALYYLRQFGNQQSRYHINQFLSSLKRQSLAGTSLNFDRDIKPWLGGILVSVLPSETSEDADLLMILAIQNQRRANQFINRLNAEVGGSGQPPQYRGFTIYEYGEESGKIYHIARVDDRLLVAASPEPIQKAIDTSFGEPNLAELWKGINAAETANQATTDISYPLSAAPFPTESHMVPMPLITIFVADYNLFLDKLSEFSDSSWESWSRVSKLAPIKSAMVSLGVEPTGFRMRGIMQQRRSPTPVNSSPQVGQILSRFPSETVAMVNSQGINALWLKLVDQSQIDPSIQDMVKQIRYGLAAIELDADEEVFGWMDGEFALAAIASEKGILAPLGLGGALVLETSNQAIAQNTLDQLDEIIAQSNPPVNVEQRTIEGIEVTEWNDPQQGTLFGHGWLTPNLLFVAFGGPVVEAMTQVPNPSLTETTRFQKITKSLPEPLHSYVYLDMENLLSWATSYLLAAPAVALPRRTISLLNSVQGVGISTTQPTDDHIAIEVLLTLKPRRY